MEVRSCLRREPEAAASPLPGPTPPKEPNVAGHWRKRIALLVPATPCYRSTLAVRLLFFPFGAIDNCGESQRQIAYECGYPNPNIITSFKRGHTKLPVRKVPEMARALGADPALLLRKALREYDPEVPSAVEKSLGPLLTENEIERLDPVRNTCAGIVPKLSQEQGPKSIYILVGGGLSRS